MINGKCPSCSSTNVFKRDQGVYMGERYLFVETGFATNNCDYESYVCVDCGYYENHIKDKGKLQSVQKKWTKVS